MIVFDLRCTNAHVFEAWFGSTGDYEAQGTAGLISCPLCGDQSVAKAVMAPAIPAKSNRRDTACRPEAADGPDPAAAKAMLKALAEAQAAMTANSEYVGSRFADEARAMHYGESDARGIYGETSAHEAAELRDEGIDAVPLLFPARPRGDA